MAIRNYHWDPVNDCVLSETDESGNTIVTYTHEPGPFGPLLSENRGGTEYYHHYDALGSTTMLTDDTGTVTDTFEYDAWGNIVERTGTTPTPYQWLGKIGYQFDAQLNSFYVRRRAYSPIIARWESADPLGLLRVLHLYAYANNAPLLFVDPSGLENVTFAFNAFISKAHGGPWIDEPGGILAEFESDYRDFGQAGTSRISSEGSFDSCSIGTTITASNTVGASHRRYRWCSWCSWIYEAPRTAPLTVDRHRTFCKQLIVNYPCNCNGTAWIAASATYPYATFGPGIDYSLTISFYGSGDTITYDAQGSHDNFPDYELLIDGAVVYKYPSPYPGPTPWNLWWYPMKEFYVSGTIDKKTNCKQCSGTCS